MRTLLLLALLGFPVQDGPVEGPPSQDLLIGKDPNKRYFLIGPKQGVKTPPGGFRLLVIMPGGDGSAEFHPFVKAIAQNSLSKEYLAVQPVSVKWKPDQEIIWPTHKLPVPDMKFTTEEFVTEIVKDVQKRHKIDPEYVFTLSWSSSGPAAYLISLQEGTPITGSFVAMAVYRPTLLPPRERAKGHGYYIYHSKQDRTCPFWMAEKGRDDLKKAGAKVEFATYEGGHGWFGDRFGDIRKGVEWLEKNHAAPTWK